MSAGLSVLHLSAVRIADDPRGGATFAIWRAMAEGARRYTVVARNAGPGDRVIREDRIELRLLGSRIAREAEYLATQFRAVSIADEVGADVVISQNPALGGLAGARIARRRGIGHLTELHAVELVRRAPLWSQDAALQRLSAPAMARATRIRALCPRMGREAAARYGAAIASRLTILPPRVDLTRFTPGGPRETSPGRALRVMMAGALTDRKGQLRAVAALRACDLPLELRIAGDGPDRAALERAAQALPGPARVTLLGRLDHAALAAEMQAADAFLMFSRHEGTPRAIMEAMACALPVLTTEAGYCADMIEDGVEGLILRGDAGAALRAALARLAADPAQARRMGAAGRARAARDYAADRLYPRYRALISEVAEAGRR